MASDTYCVFGNPIAHSLSPNIHQAFAAQSGASIQYEKKFVELDGFSKAVNDFFSGGGKGANVTVPFKQEAWQLAKNLSERAQLAGAVNTLWLNERGELCGDNTDGLGLVSDLRERNGWVLKGKTILILGAGGAARGVLLPLLEESPALTIVANRTVAKAEALQGLFSDHGQIQASAFSELAGLNVDIVINATSASLGGELPAIPKSIMKAGLAVYDMVYAKEPTAFLAWSEQQGVTQLSDGLGMLVGQAAESFYIWRGVKPDVDAVMRDLR